MVRYFGEGLEGIILQKIRQMSNKNEKRSEAINT